MAFNYPIDPNTPTDLTRGYDIDNAVRDIKNAILERFAGVFRNWPDGDPLLLEAGVINNVDLFDPALKIPLANIPGGAFTIHTHLINLAGVSIAADAVWTQDIAANQFSPALTDFGADEVPIVHVNGEGGVPSASIFKIIRGASFYGPPYTLRIGLYNASAAAINFSATPPFSVVRVILLKPVAA